MKKLLLTLFLSSFLVMGCLKSPVPNPVENIPPETHLFVEGRTDTVGGRQMIYWWGNDPDGYVVGYYIKIDTSDWVWTTSTESLIIFHSESTVIEHRFQAVAVDNEGAQDPTPAEVVIPTINTPPTIAFVYNSLPQDTTFPVATFYWEAHDDDGDQTISGYLWKLDTDSTWNVIDDGTVNHITIRDIEPGERTFTVKAFDEAGAISPDSATYTWVVKPVRGHILLVDDESGDMAGRFYRSILDSMGIDTTQYSIWPVERGLPYSPYDIAAIVNDLGFDLIIWYTGNQDNHITGVQGALATYIDNGKKLLLISQNIINQNNPTNMFVTQYLHVDTVVAVDKNLFPSGNPVYPETLITSTVAGYPDTLSAITVVPYIDAFEPDSEATALYRLPEAHDTTALWPGTPAVAIRYPSVENGDAQVIFFAIQLDKMDKRRNVYDLLRHIIRDEFGTR